MAVTARFQHQRSTLLTQRQGIYARLQRPSDHVNVTQEAIDEFLRVRGVLAAAFYAVVLSLHSIQSPQAGMTSRARIGVNNDHQAMQ